MSSCAHCGAPMIVPYRSPRSSCKPCWQSFCSSEQRYWASSNLRRRAMPLLLRVGAVSLGRRWWLWRESVRGLFCVCASRLVSVTLCMHIWHVTTRDSKRWLVPVPLCSCKRQSAWIARSCTEAERQSARAALPLTAPPTSSLQATIHPVPSSGVEIIRDAPYTHNTHASASLSKQLHRISRVMAKTRGAAKREKKQEAPQTSCDSTVRQWGHPSPPARRYRRGRGGGVAWIDMPENALYKVFDCLLQDKQALQAVSGGCSMGAGQEDWQRRCRRSATRHAPRAARCALTPRASTPPPQFRSAAACCRTWRLASQEVLLDDTAASRPEL